MRDSYEFDWNRGRNGDLVPSPAPMFAAGPNDAGQPPATEARISCWHLAWTHKLLLVAFLALGAVAGTAYVILRAPLYSASTTVELVGLNQSFMGMNQVDPQAGTDMTSASASNIQTQTRLLTSRGMLRRVMERMGMEMTPITSAPVTFFGKLRSRIPFAQREPLEQTKEALESAAKSVSARGVGATRLIEIQCESTSPEMAANFLNTLASEHVSQNQAARSNVTQRTSQWMESQLEEARARLQDAGGKLREFVRQSGMDFFPEQSTLADTKLRQLQVDLAAVQADRIAKQARWELAKSAPIESLPDILNDPNLQTLKSRIADLRREMAQLTATLTPQHYKVERIQSQIAEVEQTLNKEKTATLKRLDNDFQEALRREKLLSSAYNSQTHTVGGQADKASQYAMLKRDVEMSQQVYNTLLQQSTQAALVALAPASNIRVVDVATPNSIPANPVPVRDIPLGTLAGGGLGYGLLWLRENARRKRFSKLFDAPGHTRTVLGVPELGVIPSAEIQQPKRLLPRRTLSIPAANGHPVQMELATWQNKSSVLAESFRQTLTSILRAKPQDRNPLYVVTSVGPGEGKTTLSANLAIAMAAIGMRVLLVDADLRRPRLHALFDLHDRKGLRDLLTSPGNEVLDEFVHATQVADLWVMTHGLAKVETPALLSFSPRIEEIVTTLRNQFDCILLDTPPVLPFPDARLWGKYADGVVLIVRSGVTTQEDAMRACHRFLEDGIPVLGTILNDWAPRPGSPYGHAYYNYKSYGTRS